MKSTSQNAKAPAIRNCRGFTYIALLCALVIIGITLGTVTRYWSNVSLRDKEEELLFRGDQYRDAIMKYYLGMPGKPEYPATIDDLIKDSRSASGKRYLRQKYKDPITGGDFAEIRNENMRLIGVCSSSEKEPLKQSNFPDPYAEFEGKSKYNDWKFQFIAPVIPRPAPAGTGVGAGIGPGTGIGTGRGTGPFGGFRGRQQ